MPYGQIHVTVTSMNEYFVLWWGGTVHEATSPWPHDGTLGMSTTEQYLITGNHKPKRETPPSLLHCTFRFTFTWANPTKAIQN